MQFGLFVKHNPYLFQTGAVIFLKYQATTQWGNKMVDVNSLVN